MKFVAFSMMNCLRLSRFTINVKTLSILTNTTTHLCQNPFSGILPPRKTLFWNYWSNM